MPRVPTYDSFQVAQNTLPQARAVAPDLPDVAGQQTQQMARTLGAVGQGAGEIAVDMAKQASQTRIDDAMNQAVRARVDLETEATKLKGRNALDRPDGKSLPDEYTEKFKQRIDELNSGLGNDYQRRAFQHQAAQLQNQFYSNLSTHMAAQQQAYTVETNKVKLETAIDQAGRLSSDETAFQQALGAVRSAVSQQVKDSGGDENIAASEYRKAADQTYYARYKAWQQENAGAALAHFQSVRSEIGPLMRDRIGDELFRAAEPQLAVAAKPWVLSAGLAPVGSPEMANAPRGVRNNNPGNIVRGETPWRGEVPGNDPRFATFATPEDGMRAMGKNLLSYQDKYGLNTVEGIVARWAPASENDVSGYTSQVSKNLGVKPDEAIDLHNPEMLSRLMGEMIRVEQGKHPYGDEQIKVGAEAALGLRELPPTSGDAAQSPVGIARMNLSDPGAKTGIAVIDRLAPDQRLRVFQLAKAQAHQDMEQARGTLGIRVQDASAEYLSRGSATNPPSESEFISAYGQADGVRKFREFQDTASLGLELQRAKTSSNADLDRMLLESKPDTGPGFADRDQKYKTLQQAVSMVKEARANDPVLYAMQSGAFGLKPFTDFGNESALALELSRRGETMNQISQSYGTPPALMSKQEVDAFGRYVGSLQAEDKARVIGSVANAAGVAGVQALSRQLADKHGSLAIAAMLSGFKSPKGDSAAVLYLQGREAIEQKRARIDPAVETGTRADIYKSLNGVYMTPQALDAAAEAAYGIFAKRATDGYHSVEDAVGLATGGIMEFNGKKIAKPYGWDDGQFRDALAGPVAESIRKSGDGVFMGGQLIDAEQFAKALPGARLQTFGLGSYLVMAGNDVARKRDGSPFVLKVAPDVR